MWQTTAENHILRDVAIFGNRGGVPGTFSYSQGNLSLTGRFGIVGWGREGVMEAGIRISSESHLFSNVKCWLCFVALKVCLYYAVAGATD